MRSIRHGIKIDSGNNQVAQDNPPSRSRFSGSQPTAQQISGRTAEDDALSYLTKQGLVLTERNYRSRGGELDLIMRDGSSLVFVEVRQRRHAGFGGAAASVTPTKQAKLVRAAQNYLLRFPQLPPCRFDVVAIDGGVISWLKNVIQP